MRQMPEREKAALERLMAVAQGGTGQSRRVANFLLAWWNASACGGFDLTDFWNVDVGLMEDMLLLTRLIAHAHHYPDEYGYGPQFEQVVRMRRPAKRKRRR